MSKYIESVCNTILESTTYKWNKVPIKMNYDIFIKIVDKLLLMNESDKISYSVYPPNDTDIYIMEYSIMQGIKRWWYADNRWKTFELMELLLLNAVLYDSADSKCYDKTKEVCLKLKTPYGSCEEFCKKYDELIKFIAHHYISSLCLNNFQYQSNNQTQENNNMQFFLGSSKESTVDAFNTNANVSGNERKNEQASHKILSDTDKKPLHPSCTKHNCIISKVIHDDGGLSTSAIPISQDTSKSHAEVDADKCSSDLLSDIKQSHIEDNSSNSHVKSKHLSEQLKKSTYQYKYSKKIKTLRKKRRRFLLFW